MSTISTEHTNEDDFDVLIVGYGTTGMALAYWLGAAGHRTAVVERWPDLHHLPPAGHVDGEVMRLFQRMGIAEEITADFSITGHGIIKGSDGNVLATISPGSSDQGWAAHCSLYQPHLERSLDRCVRGTGAVTVMQGWAAEQIDRTDDGRVRPTIESVRHYPGRWRGARHRCSRRCRLGRHHPSVGPAGTNVVVSTGRAETHDYLKRLGAARFIDRAELSTPGRPLQKEQWTGAVDTVGSTTLANVLAQPVYGGAVTACGLAGGSHLPATVLPHILRGVALLGIDVNR